MKRVLGPLLVGLGVFCLTLAVLLPTVALPRLEKNPTDTYTVVRAVGEGSYLNPETFTFVDQDDITIERVVRGDVDASDDDVVVYDYSQTLLVTEIDDPLNVITERVRLDRKTAQGVGGRGDRPDHEGAYVFKLPFNVSKDEEYQLHEPTAVGAYPIRFVRETTIQGLDVYEFAGGVPEVVSEELAVPGELVGAPEVSSVFVEEIFTNNDRNVFVEPRTGLVVNGTSTPRRFFRPSDFGTNAVGEETTVFEAEVEYDEATITERVEDAKDAKSQLDLLGRTLPLVLGLLGLLLILGGLATVAVSRRRDTRGEHASD